MQFKHLHFELCYYSALEEAIARGLSRVEAGAQGEHKLQRGYLPSLTYSSHWLRSPVMRTAVQHVTEREAVDIVYTLQALTVQASPYKRGVTATTLLSKVQAMALSPISSLSDSLSSGSSIDGAQD